MAAAPPSAAGAEASGAGVAKASEVCNHHNREAELEEEKKTSSQEIRQRTAGIKDKYKKFPGKANDVFRHLEH